MIGAISAMQNAAVRQAIEVAVMRQGLDVQEAQGEAAVQLIEEAGQVTQAASAALASDTGQLIDVYL